MSEMCVDKRTGRKSSRYAELRQAEYQRKKARELKREQAASGIPETQTPISPVTLPTVPDFMQLTVPAEEDDNLLPVTTGTARVMTDAEGNIIIDQSSLQVDRHAIHPSTLTESLIHTTETIFSSKTNSATYASTRTHASNTIRWLPDDNERFYTALRMFGTDFTMVASYLGGGKNRRHIKNKFYREEKLNGDKLTWALKNRLEVDKAGLEERRGSALQPSDELREELENIKNEAAMIMAMPRYSEVQGQTGVRNEEPPKRPGIIASHFDSEDPNL
jgi:transcription factor TFIIIB component B''